MQASFKLLTQEFKPIPGKDEGSPLHDIYPQSPMRQGRHYDSF